MANAKHDLGRTSTNGRYLLTRFRGGLAARFWVKDASTLNLLQLLQLHCALPHFTFVASGASFR